MCGIYLYLFLFLRTEKKKNALEVLSSIYVFVSRKYLKVDKRNIKANSCGESTVMGTSHFCLCIGTMFIRSGASPGVRSSLRLSGRNLVVGSL